MNRPTNLPVGRSAAAARGRVRTAALVAFLALVVSLALLAPASASAFSDPAFFAAPAEKGGGAGRYFTGSPADGHGCAVCHAGGLPPRIHLEGLPEITDPGVRYDITVTWEQPDISHALHLELVDAAGRHPGVELTSAEDLPVESRCDGDPDGSPGVYAVDLGPRRVLGVQDCGARTLRFSFVAPAEPLFLAVAAVRSDSSATLDGDGVLEQRTTLSSSAEVETGCALRAGPRGIPGAPGAWTTACLLAAASIVVRRRRRADRAERHPR